MLGLPLWLDGIGWVVGRRDPVTQWDGGKSGGPGDKSRGVERGSCEDGL